MPLLELTSRIKEIAASAGSESKLEGEFNQILKELLAEFGIHFDPHVNETLKSMGLSQVDSDRPDGVFGHIVYDYKIPGFLASPNSAREAKAKLEKYLDLITGGHVDNAQGCMQWFGYVTDGISLLYCRSNGNVWLWSRSMEISASTLLFLVHVYRSLSRKPLTAELLSGAFGKHAEVARELIRVMCAHLSKPRHKTNMLFREWKRLFEQVSTYELEQLPSLKQWAVANGIATKDASHILFAMHTYYSIVVKILTTELLAISSDTPSSICEELVSADGTDKLYQVLRRIENSDYYRRYRISNFLEGDFFSWYLNERSTVMANAIRMLASEFMMFEPASAIILPETKQDLLKEFYSALVDEQIRHDLGEYYTPDWLARHVIDLAGYDGQINAKVLDPACGSGTFLVECISRLKSKCAAVGMQPLDILNMILANVKGLDLNPLAVISARANYILSIYDLVYSLGHDIELPVYLADSINVPIEKTDQKGAKYLEYLLDTEIESFVLEVPWEFVNAQVLGKVLLVCEEAIDNGHDYARTLATLQSDSKVAPLLTPSVTARFEHFYEIIDSLEKRDWDKIWCRIIKNNFSPRGFAPFQFIIGNPPWVRWSRLPASYRKRVKAFCDYYGLVSGHGYTGGIESDISTVITFSAADNWLADNGIIVFLITWTVFKSGSARGFRLSQLPDGHGLRMTRIEDLTALQPFPDAANQTSIYVAQKVATAAAARFKVIPCGIWKAERGKTRIPPQASLERVQQWCSIREGSACPVGEWGTPLFTGDIQHFNDSFFLRDSSPYLQYAHRGTVSDCARVYWVKVLRYSPETNRALIRTLTEEELPRARLIDPVEGAWIEADLLYPLVRGRDIGRCCFNTEGWYQLIPNRHYENIASEEEFADRYPLTYSYLKNFEAILRNRSSYKRYQSHLPFYVVYCVGDYSFSPYKVVWLEQQDPCAFRATVVSKLENSNIPNAVIVPDHKLYFAAIDSLEEAHYLCGFLNAPAVRTWLGGFLLGKQIGTTIFEHMNVPAFDPTNGHCRTIADISKSAHAQRMHSTSADDLDLTSRQGLTDHVKALCLRS